MATVLANTDICGRAYKIVSKRIKTPRLVKAAGIEWCGHCENPRDTRMMEAEIAICHKLRGQELANVLIHEVLHAADFDKDEKWVSHVAERPKTLVREPVVVAFLLLWGQPHATN